MRKWKEFWNSVLSQKWGKIRIFWKNIHPCLRWPPWPCDQPNVTRHCTGSLAVTTGNGDTGPGSLKLITPGMWSMTAGAMKNCFKMTVSNMYLTYHHKLICQPFSKIVRHFGSTFYCHWTNKISFKELKIFTVTGARSVRGCEGSVFTVFYPVYF